MPSRLLPPFAVMADGVGLHLQHWPAREPAHGTVLLVHGLGEHLGRYHRLAARLNSVGWHVVGTDHRGHGMSPGVRGGLPRDESPLEDLAAVIDTVRASMPSPLVVLGHSLGGLIAARFAAGAASGTAPPAWYRPIEALVLSSPALDPGLSRGQRALLATTRLLLPDLPVGNGLKPEWVSRDPAVVQAYVEDPLVHDRITARLAQFIVDGGAAVQAAAGRWTVPTLLMWAGADRCVDPRGSEAFAAAAPRGIVTAQVFPAAAHEIFNEPEVRSVYDCLLGWLQGVG